MGIASCDAPVTAWRLSAYLAPTPEYMPEKKYREYVRITLNRMHLDNIVYKSKSNKGETLYGVTKFGKALAIAYAYQNV